jgi:ubiquinone/menaquinone biosynthesis C-methylase UbiE
MAKEDLSTGFRNVDQTAAPETFIHYLDAATAQIQAWKQHSFELLEVKPGAQLLDVGCGTGDDVQALGRMVGATGRVIGIDTSETLVAEARKRTEGQLLSVEYRRGDAQQLDFTENTFDGCRAERVFVHLEHPRQALAEMVRVTRSGGRIVVSDPDFGTLIVDTKDRELTRTLENFPGDHMARNGWMGRQLWALFHQASLTDIMVTANTGVLTDYGLAVQLLRLREAAERAQEAGVVTAVEATRWLGQLEEAGQRGQFFASLTHFCVSGRKP